MSREEQIQQHLAETIKEWRKERGMSQSALAEKLGMHQTAIAKIENNERRIDFATVVRIAEILGIPWDLLQAQKRDEKQEVIDALNTYISAVTDWARGFAGMLTASADAQEELPILIDLLNNTLGPFDPETGEQLIGAIDDSFGIVTGFGNTAEEMKEMLKQLTGALKTLRDFRSELEDGK